MRPPPGSLRASLAALLVTLLTSHALALAPEFGVGAVPFTGGAPAIGASVAIPLVTVGDDAPLELVARLDVASTLAFTTWPSVGLTALARADGALQPYLGTGVAVGWRDAVGGDTAFVAWTLLAGVRYPLGEAFAVRSELTVAPLAGGMGLGLGLEWAPWR